MKKNEKNEAKEESTLMKLWHNKRTHAAMVLGLWMIFLLFVMLVAFVGGNSNEKLPSINQETEEQKEEFRAYESMQNDLLHGDYKYVYKLAMGENKINYTGYKFDEYEEGYRENANETIKYRIENNMFYQVIMDELSAYDKLFENVVENYIDIEYIFNEIKDKSVTSEELENTRTYTYNYTVEDINYSIVVTTDLENITKIDITFLDNHYELNYSEISNAEIVPQKVN